MSSTQSCEPWDGDERDLVQLWEEKLIEEGLAPIETKQRFKGHGRKAAHIRRT